jgi:hypothetical protein
MTIRQSLREEVIKKAAGKCSICGRADVPLEIDHILPLSRGGTDALDNLRAVCRSCHVIAFRTPPEELSNLKEELSKAYEIEHTATNAFLDKGFAVISGSTGPYGGADLIARGTDPISKTKVTFVVECKYTRQDITKEMVAQFASKLEHTKADYGLLVSNTRATEDVLGFARSLGISIVSPEELSDYLGEFEEQINSG